MKYTLRISLLGLFLLAFIIVAVSAAADPAQWVGAFYVKGKIGLKWQPVSGVGEYSIYRKAGSQDFEKLISVDKAQYFDTDLVGGTTYTYKIAYSDESGEIFSSEKKVTVPGAKTGEFKAPVWSGARIERDKILLRWDPVPGAIAYNIYRSTSSGTDYEIVGNATTYRHADDQNLEKGTTYYYVITALNDEFDETEYSEEDSIKFGQSAEEIEALKAAEEEVVLEEIPLTHLFDITKAGGGQTMNQPADVFLNSKENIYVTDALNFQVNCYDNAGKFLFSFGEQTPADMKENPPAGTFMYPFTLFIDKDDLVYVSDVTNNDIQVFNPEGKFIKRIKVKVEEGMEEFRPNGLHVLDNGNIVATDAGNHRFVIIDQEGKVLLSKGGRGDGPGQFIFPDEVCVTPDNTICIVDVINCRIQEFDLEGNFIRTFGSIGQTAGHFGRPKGCFSDGSNRIWVSDAMANIVQVFTLEGEVKSAIGNFEDKDLFLATPRGMFIKGDRFYVVNRLPNKIMVFKIG